MRGSFSSKGIYMEKAMETILEYARLLGSFTWEQAYYMRPDVPRDRIDRALAALKSNDYRLIHPCGGGRFTLNAAVDFDSSMVAAAWPMLIHKGNEILDDSNSDFYIGSSPGPAKLSYCLRDVLYDVVILDGSKRNVLQFIDRDYEAGGEAACGARKCIFVVPDRASAEELPMIRIPHLFAVVNEGDPDNAVTFFD